MQRSAFSVQLCSGLLVSVALATSSCSTTDVRTSGILGDYSGFERRDDNTLVQVLASGTDLASYRRVMLEEVVVYLDPESSGRVLMPSDQYAVATRLRAAMFTELQNHFDLVQDPTVRSADLLRVRVALTDIVPGEDGELGEATAELEVIDSQTGERIAAAVSRRVASRTNATRDERLAEAERMFADWAAALRGWLVDVTGA
ncbi:MAG: DUF3313 domain-containing protein [bacterium]|nr:DUF3313 domain-containing protein [bacterium]